MLTGAPKNLIVTHFPDSVGHFGAPWRPFWNFKVLIEGMIESKNLLCKSCWGSNNLGFDLFPDLVGHFGLSRRSSVAVPPSPLGWYYLMISFIMRNSEQLRRTLGMLLTRKIVTMQIRITAMFLSSLACTFLTLLTL